MSKAHPPELKKFMDKKLSLKLNGGRHVQGILRGFDPFMNLVMDDCLEMSQGGQQHTIGMVAQLSVDRATVPTATTSATMSSEVTAS
ncbi:small nuclear ribonucleoprotein G isoform X1 [Vanacampus margaritifer]